MTSTLELCEEYILNHKWVLWYHDVDNPKWDLSSYIKLPAISTLKEYHALMNSLKDISAGMFFLMKEDIPPMWESPDNKYGGYWSYRIQKADGNKIWRELTTALVGETIAINESDMRYINGVSFSPKISNAIIRIWLSDSKKKSITMISDNIPGLNNSEAMFNKYK